MKKIQKYYPLQWKIFIFLLVLGLPAGCTQVPSSIGTPTKDVGSIANGERVHVKDRLIMEDFRAMAAKVTEKMLASGVVQKWQAKERKPTLLVVAVPRNPTSDTNIITDEQQEEIISRIVDSGVARIIDDSKISRGYDYIIKTVLTYIVQQKKNGSRLTFYTCKLQMFSSHGERLGQWHSKIGMAKAPRSFF